MKTSIKSISTKTERGTEVTINVTVKKGWEKVIERLYNDGWESEVEKMKEINETNITITANGQVFKGSFSYGIPSDLKIKGVVAIFGKIALTENVYKTLYSAVEEAVKEAETDKNWIELQAKKEQIKKSDAEYSKNKMAVENMMTLNGKTY